VSKRISSSDWTGPVDAGVRRGAFTHRIGEYGGTTDYARLNHQEPFTLAPPPELRGVLRLAVALFLSPLLLVAAWFGGEWGVQGMVISDPSGFLLLWGWSIAAFSFWQLISRSLHLILVRTFLLGLLIVATIGIAIGYVVVAQRAYAAAAVGDTQRVFRYVAGSKKTMFGRSAIFRHQRADGTDLEGASKWPHLEHGQCITAEPVKGPYGFRWLRVIEQVPPQRAGQLSWPVRREDCFSDKPLADLAR